MKFVRCSTQPWSSLHGRDLEGLVWMTTGLLASCYITEQCGRPGGPRPTDLAVAVMSSLQVGIPAIGSQVPHAATVPIPFFTAHGSRGPRAFTFDTAAVHAMLDNVRVTAVQSDSVGTLHTGKPALFTSLHTSAFVPCLFPMFAKYYAVLLLLPLLAW